MATINIDIAELNTFCACDEKLKLSRVKVSNQYITLVMRCPVCDSAYEILYGQPCDRRTLGPRRA